MFCPEWDAVARSRVCDNTLLETTTGALEVQDFKHQIVLTTCGDEQQAARIAEELVSRGLAACVNILPSVRSVYRWQNEIHADDEVLLVVKSTRAQYVQIEQCIQELHSYELPEIVAVPIVTGLTEYLQWIDEQVAVR